MNNTPKDPEMLSRLMDGEWQKLDPAVSIKNICDDEELKATWSRYHLMRDVIRNEDVSIDTDLSARISAAIDDEPVYTNVATIGDYARPAVSADSSDSELDDAFDEADAIEENVAPQAQSHNHNGMWYSGAALAACMALATVVGLNLFQTAPEGAGPVSVAGLDGSNNPDLSGAGLPGVVLPEVELVSNKGTYWVTPDAERDHKAEQRLNRLLSQHIENSPTAGRLGMLPYSRLVGYDAVTPE